MVVVHTGCKQQVREINNAIAFLFVARDSFVYYLVSRGKSRARENSCMHTETSKPVCNHLRAYFKKSECSHYRDDIWNLPGISKVHLELLKLPL